jgi:hypothetical protein
VIAQLLRWALDICSPSRAFAGTCDCTRCRLLRRREAAALHAGWCERASGVCAAYMPRVRPRSGGRWHRCHDAVGTQDARAVGWYEP